MKYLTPRQFQDFCVNQERLIEILNHRMTSFERSITSIKDDVGWIKKIGWVFIGILVSLITAYLIKIMVYLP